MVPHSSGPDETGVFDAVFVSRPEDLSDLEDILPSLDDVLNPHADFGSDSDLPLWDSMLSGISCPGMQSHSDQTAAEGLPQGVSSTARISLAHAEVQQPSTSNSACSCDLQQGVQNHSHAWQPVGCSPSQTTPTGQDVQQQQAVHSLSEPTSSRDSNPCAASPDSGDDRGGSSKKRKVDASSDEDCSGRHPSPSSAPSQERSADRQAGEEGDEEQKRMARMQRNRESAMLSRQRKKMQLDELEQQNKQLQATNTHLSGMVAGLVSENAALRHQLAMAGQPALQPFAPAPALPGAPGAMPGAMPRGQPQPYVPWQFPGVPYMAATPKVPIPQLRRTDVKKAAKAPTKKAKAAAGGTALLGLVTLLCLTGNVPFWPTSPSVPAHLDSQAIQTQVALPARMHAGGRVLQSTAEDPALNVTASWGPNWKPSAQISQAALAAIPVKPSVKASTKAVALQHLKDLAPITLYTDWGLEGGVSNVWHNVKGSGSRGSDLMPPMQCREVFRLDAVEGSDAKAAWQQLQNHAASLSSFRGRALMGPIAMPPTSRVLPPLQAYQDGEGKKGSKATIGCEGGEDDLIVSIMLPSPKAVDSDKENRSFTAVDEIYVVAVRPGKEYHTHACSLQSPILI